MILRRTAYLLAFAALAAATTLAVDRTVQPHITERLLLVGGVALIVGLPGLIHRRLAPLSLLLLPMGAYLLLRIDTPVPTDIEGWRAQYGFYAAELRYGAAAYAEDVFPLTLAGVPGLRLLILLWVYGVTALAAILALGGRRPLVGAGVLLGLLGVSLTVDQSQGDTRMAAVFLILIVLLLLTAQGLTRRRWGPREALAGLGVGGVSILMALALLAGIPGIVTGGWQDWRTWDPFGQGQGTAVVFNWRQNYPRLLDPGNPIPVLRVTSPVPSYWKATDLDVFTGDSWLNRNAFLNQLDEGPGTRTLRQPSESDPTIMQVTERFALQNMSTTYIFVGGRANAITLDLPVSIYASDAGALRADTTLNAPLEYEIAAEITRLRPEQLVGLGWDYTEEVRAEYTALPLPSAAQVAEAREAGEDWQQLVKDSWAFGDEFLAVYDLNASVVTGATDPYEVTLLIERFLRTRYLYSLEVPDSTLRSPIAAFLLDTHTGYCQHFAGSMALLLRLNGIPARVATGFTTGQLVDPQTYLVTSNNAHSWVEVYFPRFGWLPFDPTPGRALPLPGVSSTSPGFVDPFPHDASSAATTPTLPPTAGLPPEGGNFGADSPGAAAGAPVRFGRLALAALLVMAAFGWPPARRRYRGRGLRRGSDTERLRASLALLRADAVDLGLAVPRGATLNELAALLRQTTGVDATPVINRAQAVLFGGRPPSGEDLRAAERLRRRSVASLRRRRGPVWTVAAWYGCPGVARWWTARRAQSTSRRRGRSKSPRWQFGG